MHHAARDRNSLARRQLDRPVLEVHDEPALHEEEELILVVVLVPVELAFQDAEANDRVVDAGECLVVPLVSARLYQRGDIDNLERVVEDVEVVLYG